MATPTKSPPLKSGLLNYLPTIYQDPGWVGAEQELPSFISCFLLPFENILLGREDGLEPKSSSGPYLGEGLPKFQGLEQKIANLQALFDARHTPEEFLEWLAGWAALTLRKELTAQRQRALIAGIIPLYGIRGTKHYLERLLGLYLGGSATVHDQYRSGLQIGSYSTLAIDTYLGGTAPHYFRVTLAVPPGEDVVTETQLRMARDVIELAKPAHTYYDLEIHSPRMQLGVHSCVAVDTFLA